MPAYATSAVLIVVGVSMFQAVTRVSWDRLEEALPMLWGLALLAAVLLVLEHSRH